jgi:poly-gamma-glutamate synthesis protein (capsule biosynthesis protein)
LEVPLAGKPYSGYPNFSSPDALLDGLKNAGYDIMLTANNHVVDRGKQGLVRTIKTIKSRNLLHAGSYIDEIQRDSLYPIILEQKGIRIAFLNCTYGSNGIAVVAPNRVNYLDTTEIKKDIQKAKSKNVDFIVMNVHWGSEYELTGNTAQKMYADFFIRNGINLVVGSHPHVVQNAEIQYNNDSIPIPVFYSLGNSISNQRKPHTDGGIILKVVIGSQNKRILNTTYMPVYVHKGILSAVYQYHLVPTPLFLNDSTYYQINSKDRNSLIYFDRETRKRISNFDVFQ